MTPQGSTSARELNNEIRAFIDGLQSLVLATVGQGAAQASYAPFVEDGGDFHVFVSALARHTAHLRAQPRVGVLFIEDEAHTRNPFARRRLSYTCAVHPVPRESGRWTPVLTRFAERFGAIVDTLRELPDFELFSLTPQSGRYVKGFGQAYRITDGHIEPLGPPS